MFLKIEFKCSIILTSVINVPPKMVTAIYGK